MTPRVLLHALPRVLPLLLSLAVPTAALCQPAAPGPLELAPETRARLAQVAADTLLPQWQRDVMLSLARTGATAMVDSSTVDASDAPLAVTADAADGAWDSLPPTRRCAHSAIYDPVRDRMVVFGGAGDRGYLNDVWALSLAGTPAWTRLTPSGTPPGIRYAHSAIYDPVRDRVVVFGGSPGAGYFNDVWALSLAGTPAWTQLTPTGTPPSGRLCHSAIYDPVRDRMVVFGGREYWAPLLDDVWALSLAGAPEWTQLTPTGTPPSARNRHSAVYDPVRDRMVVFGGATYGVNLNDVWALSLAGASAWTQ